MKDKFIRSILRFVIKRKHLYTMFSKYDWFNNLVYEQAQKLLGNR